MSRIKVALLAFSLASGLVSTAQAKKEGNLLLISVDGYRWQELFKGADSGLLFPKKYRHQDSARLVKKYWAESVEERRSKLMPFFWSTIRKQGQLYGNRELGNLVNVRNKYWFSYPGRSESLSGYYDSLINSNEYPNNPNETILDFLSKQSAYKNRVAVFASWDAVARIVNRDRNGIPLINPGEKINGGKLTEAEELANEIQNYLPSYFGPSVRFDVHTFALAKSYMKARHPKVVHIDFADPDEFGHSGQYDAYLDAAHYIDAMVGSLWSMIQQDPFYMNNTTILIYPDHGRGLGDKWTGHGRSAPGSNETWLAVIGPGVAPLGEISEPMQLYQDQFAQTAAQLLGMFYTANHPVGEVIPTVGKK